MGALCTTEDQTPSKEKPNKVQSQSQSKTKGGQASQMTSEIMSTYNTQKEIKFVLGYWKIRGRAQTIRYLLEYCGFKYEEKYYENPEQWFQVDKQSLGLNFPNLPYIIEDKVKLTETAAVEEYIIRKSSHAKQLLGEDFKKQSQIQMIQSLIRDIFSDIIAFCFSPKEEFYNNKQKKFEEKVFHKVNYLKQFLEKNKPFILGSLSYADFLMYEFLLYVKNIFTQEYIEYFQIFDTYLKNFENIDKLKNSNFTRVIEESKMDKEPSQEQQGIETNQQKFEAPTNQGGVEHYILGYWSFRGRVQIMIFLLEFLKVKYEIKWFSSPDEWFQGTKQNLPTQIPNLPYLQDKQTVITESDAILEYIIKKENNPHFFNPQDVKMQAKVQNLYYYIKEFFGEIIKMCFDKEKFEDLRVKNYKEKFHGKLRSLAKTLHKRHSFFDKISLCDFLFYELLQYVKKIYLQQYNQFFKVEFQNLEQHIQENEQIKAYINANKDKQQFQTFLPPQMSEFTGSEYMEAFEFEEEVQVQKKMVLGYWGIRGKAQCIRYLLEYLQVDYEEMIYTNGDKWFKEDKVNLNTSLPNLPYINDNEDIITESIAILEYVARKSDRYSDLYMRIFFFFFI